MTEVGKTRPVSWLKPTLRAFEEFPEGAQSICLGKWLHFGGGYLLGEADEEGARADAVDGRLGDGLMLDGHGEIEAEFQ